ncbi:MAG: AAA domain-containing protein [Lentisphaerae bacterium]|nr:AAA domain-containing protein [Lentisphaerota bacterium]
MAARTGSSHGELLKTLETAIRSGLNVLIEGAHGCGKTSAVRLAAEAMGLRLKYFSASTLDPFVDLVGLPVPSVGADGRLLISYHRNAEVLDCEVLFFDELNRAHSKTLNAVLEIIQFHTLNGEALPRLRAVIAACNPPEPRYQVERLDPALIDRFHLWLEFTAGPDKGWFEQQFGAVGKALCAWYKADLDEAQRQAVSPRKLEHMAMLIKAGLDPKLSLSSEIVLPYRQLWSRLGSPTCVLDVSDFVADPARYGRAVREDMEVAYRFAFVLPTMRPEQIVAVREVILELPAEVLTQLASVRGMLKRIVRAISEGLGAVEGEAFAELWKEKMAA